MSSTRTFEFKDDKSSKFREITQNGNSVTVRYGKTGTQGQSQDKVFEEAVAASKHADKLIKEKTGKGYVEQGGDASAGTGAVVSPEPLAQPEKPATKKAQKSTAAKPSKPRNPAQDPEATPESLLALLDKDDATNRLLAKHPRASAELLEKLSHSSDKATRQSVASNPNTAPEALVRLGQQFPKEFLTNPALDLLLMINPALMEEVPDAFLIRVLKQNDCPSSLLIWAAGDFEAKVQLAVAMNPNAPEQALERLRLSQYQAVREAVKAPIGADGTDPTEDPEMAFEQAVKARLHSLAPRELHEAWNKGDIGLAQWASLPPTFRWAKAIGSDVDVPAAIVRFLIDTSWTIESIREALPNYEAWDDVAINPKTPVPILEVLAKDSDESVRCAVARNNSTPSSLREVLAKDSHEFVREGVAMSNFTAASMLEALSKDKDEDVRSAVAGNISTPASVLEALSKDKGEYVQYVRSAVAGNISTPASVLEALSKDKDGDVRIAVAGNPCAATSALEVLVKEKKYIEVLIAVAENVSATTSVLAALGKDKYKYVRSAVAGNPSAAAFVLEALARDKEEVVRSAVAGNPSAAAFVLEALARDKEEVVRRAVAGNTSAAASVLQALARDIDEDVRAAVAKNTSTPVSVLEVLGSDKNSKVLAAAAQNQAAPIDLLIKLAADRVVAIEAISNPGTSLAALLPLVKSKSVGIRVGLAEQAHRNADLCRALWSDAHSDVRQSLLRNQQLAPELLDEMVMGAESEKDVVALLVHPQLSSESVQLLTDKLLKMPATASLWYRDALAKADAKVVAAVESGSVLSYFGKDPNKAVLAKRALAPVMALCSGPFVEPSRIAKVAGSTDWLVRAAVARNPGTPPNLIKKLSADAHYLVASLALQSKMKQQLTEAQPNEVGPELISDRVIQEVVSRLRHDELIKLFTLVFPFFCDDVWCDHVPAGHIAWMTAIVMENRRKYTWVGLPFSAFENRLSPVALGHVVELAVRFEVNCDRSHTYVRRWAAGYSACPQNVLKMLAEDEDPEIVLAALRNGCLSSEDAEAARQNIRRLRGKKLLALLESDLVFPDMLEERLNSSDRGVLRAIARNPNATGAILDKLFAGSDERIFRELAGIPSAPADVINRLAKHKDDNVCCSVASNPSAPADVLNRLAKHKDDYVRCSVASNPSAPFGCLEELSHDKDVWVRRAVAKNPATPIATLEVLAKDSDEWLLQSLASNPSVPSTVLDVLGKKPTLLRHVASNPSAPDALLEACSTNVDVNIRWAAARNPSASPSILEALSRDASAYVLRAVAMNPSSPQQLLTRMAHDGPYEIEVAVAMNPSAPAQLQDQVIDKWVDRLLRAMQFEGRQVLGQSVGDRVRMGPADLLRGLDLLGLTCLTNDNKDLTKLSRSRDWLTRLGVALHPEVTEGILKVLRQDSDPDVARAAAVARTASTRQTSAHLPK
jgi:predicted DNA-binding WGR domain protein